jgi:hypothetical protein
MKSTQDKAIVLVTLTPKAMVAATGTLHVECILTQLFPVYEKC